MRFLRGHYSWSGRGSCIIKFVYASSVVPCKAASELTRGECDDLFTRGFYGARRQVRSALISSMQLNFSRQMWRSESLTSQCSVESMRQEATLLGEGTSAYRLAQCKRVVSFGFDETTKFGDGLASANFQIETVEGDICDEVLRGAFLIPGGCADQVASAIESKLFARGRVLLQKWIDIYKEKNGSRTWPGPKPSQLGYHRLAKSLIMSDTCNAARAAKKLITERVATEVENMARQTAEWKKMTEQERQQSIECYVGDCMQHLRNILLNAMSAEAAKMLRAELHESLNAFSAYERMSTDPMQLIRGVRAVYAPYVLHLLYDLNIDSL